MCFLAFNLIAFSDCARKMNQNVDSLKGKCIDISIEKYFRLPDPATFSRAWVPELNYVRRSWKSGNRMLFISGLFIRVFGQFFFGARICA